MKCPHCTIHFHDNWSDQWMKREEQWLDWMYRTADCPECKQMTIEISFREHDRRAGNYVPAIWTQVHPRGSARGPVPVEVPENIRGDYEEACLVLPLSPKASAALSRRCLQNILRAQGYSAPNLAQEIDMVLSETDPTKAISPTLRSTIDGVRNFGNFSAHPMTDVTSLQIHAV